jgi:hypothetical protein
MFWRSWYRVNEYKLSNGEYVTRYNKQYQMVGAIIIKMCYTIRDFADEIATLVFEYNGYKGLSKSNGIYKVLCKIHQIIVPIYI